MADGHYWVYGHVDQYVNGFFRSDEPKNVTLMPARWETAVTYLNGKLPSIINIVACVSFFHITHVLTTHQFDALLAFHYLF